MRRGMTGAMETPLAIAVLLLGLAVLGLGLLLLLRRPGGTQMLTGQAELAGRLGQLADSQAAAQAQLSERLQAQERALAQTLEERLGDLGRRVGDRLQEQSQQAGQALGALQERLAVIDAAQKNITELSSQMVGLQDILGNKQARGRFGEVLLENLLRDALPPSAFELQAPLGSGRVDCLIRLPDPPGPIAVDAKFPKEAYDALREASGDAATLVARRAFAADIRRHVLAIAEKYIVAGVTAESALMFVPSEAIYAELHANFANVVEESHRRRVWIVSPTTLMATLTTIRAILRDVQMREQAGAIQKEVGLLVADVRRLDDRVGKLQRHFDQTGEDLRQVRLSAEGILRHGQRIEAIQIEVPAKPEASNQGRLPEI
jgi:DNA recombination protein RmuC